jgi:hypothetical protein
VTRQSVVRRRFSDGEGWRVTAAQAVVTRQSVVVAGRAAS